MLLLFKVLLTPALITGATLLGRRLGPEFSGWLVGFPFTSAPVSLFLTVEQGVPFAAAAAVGSVASVAAQAAFALGFARTARYGWPVALVAGSLAFGATGMALRVVDLPALAVALVSLATVIATLRLLPASRPDARESVRVSRWDLPSRAAIATVLVVTLTTVAPLLGPFASGLVSGFPLYASVLAVFAHRTAGPAAAVDVVRGLAAGLFGFGAFFVVVAASLATLGTVATFALAALAVALVQAISFTALRSSGRPPVP